MSENKFTFAVDKSKLAQITQTNKPIELFLMKN